MTIHKREQPANKVAVFWSVSPSSKILIHDVGRRDHVMKDTVQPQTNPCRNNRLETVTTPGRTIRTFSLLCLSYDGRKILLVRVPQEFLFV